MAYNKTIWVDGQAPALNAENLNKIEEGIALATEQVETGTIIVTPYELSTGEMTVDSTVQAAFEMQESKTIYGGAY